MRNILKKSGIYFIGNFSSKILSSLLIPIYALFLTSTELGEFDFTQTLMNIIAPLLSLAVWESILKFNLSNNSKKNTEKVLSNALFFSTVMNTIVLVILIYLNDVLNLFPSFSLLSIFIIVANPFMLILQYYSRSKQDTKTFIIAGIFASVINFLGIIIFVVILKQGIFGLLLSYLLSELCAIAIISLRMNIINDFNFKYIEIRFLKKMLIFSAPLALNTISVWFMNGFSRIIITNQFGLAMNGVFAFASKFSMLLTLFAGVINMALIEEAILGLKGKNFKKNFQSNFEIITIIFLLIGILFLPTIKIFFSFLGDTDFFNAYIFIPPIMLASVFNIFSTNLGAFFQAIEKTYIHTLSTLGGAVCFVVASVLLINIYSIYGVAIAQVLGYLSTFLIRFYFAKKLGDIRINKFIFSLFFLYILATFIFINYSLKVNFVFLVILIVSIIIIGIKNYKNILEILRKT